MTNISCVAPNVRSKFVGEVISKIEEDSNLREYFFGESVDDTKRQIASKVIDSFVGPYLNVINDAQNKDIALKRQDDRLNNPEAFIKLLKNKFAVEKFNPEFLEEATDRYNKFLAKTNGSIFYEENLEGKSEEEKEEAVKNIRINSDILNYSITRDAAGEISSITAILKEPVEEKEDIQKKTVTQLETLAEKNKKVKNTGYFLTDSNGNEYRYSTWRDKEKALKEDKEAEDSKGLKDLGYAEITTDTNETGRGRSVSNHINRPDYETTEEYQGPLAAGPLGDYVDILGRMFFGEKSKLYKDDGTLKSDEDLEKLIEENLDNIFTVEGLKRIIEDFENLEQKLKKNFGEDVIFVSSETPLVSKLPNGTWLRGTPDLLAVDNNGVIHVLDFKTSNYKSYSENNSYNSLTADKEAKYGKQLQAYVDMLRASGFKVSGDKTIIRIDVFYSNNVPASEGGETFNPEKSDFVVTNKPGEIKLKDIKVKQNIEGTKNTEEIALNEYVKRMKTPSSMQDASRNDIVYIEPRLHLAKNKSNSEVEAGYELQAQEERNSTAYEQLWDSSSDEDYDWFKPVVISRKAISASDLTVMAEGDIGSKPELMPEQEIQELADLLMVSISRIVTDIQQGKETDLEEYFDSKKIENLKGKERYEIINDLGIYKLYDYVFDKFIGYMYDEDFPTKYEDSAYDTEEEYLLYKRMNDKAAWLSQPYSDSNKLNHKEQLFEIGRSKLQSLEKCIVPTRQKVKQNTDKEDTVKNLDNVSESVETDTTGELEELIEKYYDGLSNMEAYMLEARNRSNKASLAQEIRRLFEDITRTDENGNPIEDPYGWGIDLPLDSTQAMQTLLDRVCDCESIEEMMSRLDYISNLGSYQWVKQIKAKLDADKNLKIKFYRHFRKDAVVYSIVQYTYSKKEGVRMLETRIVNMKNAFSVLTQSLSAKLKEGNLGTLNVYDTENDIKIPFKLLEIKNPDDKKVKLRITDYDNFPLAGKKRTNKNATTIYTSYLDEIKKVIESWYGDTNYKNLSKEAKINHIKNALLEPRDFSWSKDKKNVIQALQDMLHVIGIEMSEEELTDYILTGNLIGEKSNRARALITQYLNNIVSELSAQSKDGIPTELTGLHASKYYFHVIDELSKNVQEHIEASIYQNGKTYYSYTNPSRLASIIKNLKDDIGSLDLEDTSEEPYKDKFKNYIERQYGRYIGWFKKIPTETIKDNKIDPYYVDWLNQLTDEVHGKDARKALKHKSELAFLGENYRDLGELGFALSILSNYFGSKADNVEDENYRWFAVPTMSNKPVNEFIRFFKYSDRKGKYKDVIINKVLLPTFQQEINRIVDVLFHFAKNSGDITNFDLVEKDIPSDVDINSLKNRIDNGELTQEDLIALSKTNSGAKFHFLWYLNDIIKDNEEVAADILNRINGKLTETEKDTDDNKIVEAIEFSMEEVVTSELNEFRRIGLFEKEIKQKNGKSYTILKYQSMFGNKLGKTEEDMEEKLTEFIWQDIAATINIIQLTGGDLAYYTNSINYQKRIAQIHSPGWKIAHDENYDDNYLRGVHISDETIDEEIKGIIDSVFTEKADGLSDSKAREDFITMKNYIISELSKTKSTDGQSYSSPTSMRKKLHAMGEWTDELEKAYKAILKGNITLENIAVFTQSATKPFLTSDVAKYSGSPTMELRRKPIQEKNSEYLIILADALARSKGKKSKLVAIFDFMEATHGNKKNADNTWNNENAHTHGIDTVHFSSVNKVGLSKVIDIKKFDEEFKGSDDEYNEALTEYLLQHVRRSSKEGEGIADANVLLQEDILIKDGKLTQKEAGYYNNEYVDTTPLEDYIIQQEVPAHLLQENGQLYGSQIRILGISDITPSPSAKFRVRGKEEVKADKLIEEYKKLHYDNIMDSYESLMEELGISEINKALNLNEDALLKQPSTSWEEALMLAASKLQLLNKNSKEIEARNNFYKRLERLLQQELTKDAKYSIDVRRACTLTYDSDGNVIDFTIPLMDPVGSRQIQMLINSIIKKRINRQRINGGPVVQTTAYDDRLHIRFKDESGELLPTFTEWKDSTNGSFEDYKEYLKENSASIAYFECYMPVPNVEFERLITKSDGTYMSIEEIKKALGESTWNLMSQAIGYRIPTEDKYSMVPLKIVGFVPKAAGQVIMMPQEITFLTGSDFDIDKMYIMLKKFNTFKLTKKLQEGIPDAIRDKKLSKEIHNKIEDNVKRILNGDKSIQWLSGIHDKDRNAAYVVLSNYLQYLLGKDSFEEYNISNKAFKDSSNRKYSLEEKKHARNNRLIDLQWAILTNKDTMSKILNPGNFIEQKKVGRVIKIIKDKIKDPSEYNDLLKMSVEELDTLLENGNPHNTTLTSSKLYYQHQNMQGTQMVGIFANNNVSHAFCSFQKIAFDLVKNAPEGNMGRSFYLDGIEIGNPKSNSKGALLDSQLDFYGNYISKTIASFLAASVDTAKDPTLADMNVNTFTGGVAMTLVRLGFNTEMVGLFLSQPIIKRVTDDYAKNKIDSYYDGQTAINKIKEEIGIEKFDSTIIQDSRALTKESLIEGLVDTSLDSETQKKVLTAFNTLYAMANDLQKLTFCTKFNSITNAVGPTIADTFEDISRVKNFFDGIERSTFYTPDFSTSNTSKYTSPIEIIDSDPILKGFYESTLGRKGASAEIFKFFFPHYYKGFKQIQNLFTEEYFKGIKLPSKIYNKLLEDYLYYLMTFKGTVSLNNDSLTYKPTLPSNSSDINYLVNITEGYKESIKILMTHGKTNALLLKDLGANTLRIRKADAFLNVDTLLFNGAQLDAQGKQSIINAWTDLIRMNDPDLTEEENNTIRRFGTDLFFYSLMRNGFGFSPKTLLQLASTVIKLNANFQPGEYNTYVDGLRGLKDLDEFLAESSLFENEDSLATRFIDQFIRNHSNNKQLVPSFDSTNSAINDAKIDSTTGVITEFTFAAKEGPIAAIKLTDKMPYKYITISTTINGKYTQELYKAESKELFKRADGTYAVVYKRVEKLGISNNFIEYNANSPIAKSVFTSTRLKSDAALENDIEEDDDKVDEIRKEEEDNSNTTEDNNASDLPNNSSSFASKIDNIIKKEADPGEIKKTKDKENSCY